MGNRRPSTLARMERVMDYLAEHGETYRHEIVAHLWTEAASRWRHGDIIDHQDFDHEQRVLAAIAHLENDGRVRLERDHHSGHPRWEPVLVVPTDIEPTNTL